VTELSRDEVALAVARMKQDDWDDAARAFVLRLAAHERDTVLLLAALLDAHPEE
jgi:hypothetical protein